ncbi:hypothetical protein MOQ_004025 [Trypanosoma cruzi marinkellei]|uniref:Uncharacterized protein n=1 Tax=Trypanosoma cruzi marinkellei TaxID=85056 RepID=K2N2H3_TRYCR|nr:hypothetical protein MOQ_004025 [Trypanosoma cruzi marinkellei]
MSSIQLDEYDLYAVDRTFVLSLFHGFCTAVPGSVRQEIVTTEADAVQFVMILRPRLTSFTHRSNISLRHPAVSMAARLYYNELRAFFREDSRMPGDNAAPKNVPVAGSSASGREYLGERRGSSYTSWPGVIAKPITVEQLTQNNWELMGSCHDVLLRNSQPRRIAVLAIASNELVNDIICRYWERITVPSGTMGFRHSSTVGSNEASKSFTFTETGSGIYATHMTALQYVYLHLRIAGILLPPSSLQTEILDSIILDLRVDAMLSGKKGGLSFGKPPELCGYRSTDDEFDDDSVGLESAPNDPLHTVDEDLIQMVEPFGASKIPFNMNKFKTSLDDLPDISFGQFWMSMLELSDNWTSTSHPMEHAIFLMELYCEVFAHEWDDEELSLLKALRANAETRHQEDAFSLMDDDERSLHILSEFTQMVSSIDEFAITGLLYQPNLMPFRKNILVASDAVSDGVSNMAAFSFQGSVSNVRPSTASSMWSESKQEVQLSRQKREKPQLITSDISTLRGRHSEGDEDATEHATGTKREDKEKKKGLYHEGRHMDVDKETLEEDEGVREDGHRRSSRDRKKQLRIGRSRREGEEGVEVEEGEKGEDEGYDDKQAVDREGRRRRKKEAGEIRSRRGDILDNERRERRYRIGDDGKRLSWRDSEASFESMYSYDSSDPIGRRADAYKKGHPHRRYSTKAFHDHEGREDEEYTVGADGVRRRRSRGGPRRSGYSKRDKYGEGGEDDKDSLSTESSSSYSVPDDELTPTSLSRRQKERERKQAEHLLRRRKRQEARQRRSQMPTAAEIAEKRNRIVQTLQMKGIHISGDALTDDDIAELGDENISEELLRRLLVDSGYAIDEIKESDFLHILSGEKEPQPADVSAEERSNVLAALRAQPSRRPPETEYARRRREAQEKLLRDEKRAAAMKRREDRRIAIKKHEEESYLREETDELKPPFSSLEDVEVLGLPGPGIAPTAPRRPPPRREGSLPFVMPQPVQFENELLTRMWKPVMWRAVQRRVRGKMPAHRPVVGEDDMELKSFPQLVIEKPSKGTPAGLHEHSPTQLEMFYRGIRPERLVKGRVPLAQPTSILGGTYHQLPSIQSHWKRRQDLQGGLTPEPPPPRQCAPVKLFSLTTKTTFAEALKESLQRYIDDKEYLDVIYRSYLR